MFKKLRTPKRIDEIIFTFMGITLTGKVWGKRVEGYFNDGPRKGVVKTFNPYTGSIDSQICVWEQLAGRGASFPKFSRYKTKGDVQVFVSKMEINSMSTRLRATHENLFISSASLLVRAIDILEPELVFKLDANYEEVNCEQ